MGDGLVTAKRMIAGLAVLTVTTLAISTPAWGSNTTTTKAKITKVKPKPKPLPSGASRI